MDYQGNPFGPMPGLMATAEYVTKLHAICSRTGNLANYSYRTSGKDDLVILGEKENYEPLSRAAFFSAKKKKNKKSQFFNLFNTLHIYLSNLKHNYETIRKQISNSTQCIGVVIKS